MHESQEAPFQKAFFALNREIGPARLLHIVSRYAVEEDCEHQPGLIFWSISFESDLSADLLRITLKCLDRGCMHDIFIDTHQSPELFKSIRAQLGSIYEHDRSKKHLRQYYVAAFEDKLGI